jgi:heptosyltransferase-3
VSTTVLVIHPGAIGDVLLARAALRELRLAYPSSALGLIARQDVGSVLLAGREIDALFSLESGALSGLLAGPDALLPRLKLWLENCVLSVCWMQDPGGLVGTLQACGVPRLIVQSVSSGQSGAHQADFLRHTLKGILPSYLPDCPLDIPEKIKEQGRAILHALGLSGSSFVLLHPSSGSIHKCVGVGILASVVHRIQAHAPVVLVSGPADTMRVRELLDHCSTKPLVFENHDLLTIASLITQAALFIGHDSGLTHLAAALATPTVALFGPTDPRRWAPRGTHVTVLTGEPCHCAEWQEVHRCEAKPCLRLDPAQIVAACLPYLL